MQKLDLYGHENRYKAWKEHVIKNGEDGLSKVNSEILLQYIFDMETGANVSLKSKKGARSYHRLNSLRQKVVTVFRMLEKRSIKNVLKVTDKEIQSIFNDMRTGIIQTQKGGKYTATSDYAQSFKSFWHWHQKVQAKKGKVVLDITEYLDARVDKKPVWVYIPEKDMPKLFEKAKAQYSVFFEFLYISGARVTEALSLIVRNFEQEGKDYYIDIPDSVAKTFGRKIKIFELGKKLAQHIEDNKLKPEDKIFDLSAPMMNRYLGDLAKELFGVGVSKGGEKFSNMTLYDFRHNSATYWLPRYRKNALMMYRFGWKSEKYILYYSEFLGMTDDIKDEDMLRDVTKTELENQVKDLQEKITKIQKTIKPNIEDIRKEIEKIMKLKEASKD